MRSSWIQDPLNQIESNCSLDHIVLVHTTHRLRNRQFVIAVPLEAGKMLLEGCHHR